MSTESKAAILARERARRGEPEPKPKKAKKAEEAPTTETAEIVAETTELDTVTES